MFSLIISIVAISLAASLMAMGMYYMGASSEAAKKDIAATSLINQSDQILAAIDIRALDETESLSSMTALVSSRYLQTVPKPPKDAYQDGQPSAADWVLLAPGVRPAVMIQNKIDTQTCIHLNLRTGFDGIQAQPDPTRRMQCFGTAPPFTLLLNPSMQDLEHDIRCFNFPFLASCRSPEDFCAANPAHYSCAPGDSHCALNPMAPECQPMCSVAVPVQGGGQAICYDSKLLRETCAANPGGCESLTRHIVLASVQQCVFVPDTQPGDGCPPPPCVYGVDPSCPPPPCTVGQPGCEAPCDPSSPDCGAPKRTCEKVGILEALYANPDLLHVPALAQWVAATDCGDGKGTQWSEATGWVYTCTVEGLEQEYAFQSSVDFVAVHLGVSPPADLLSSMPAEVCTAP